MQNTDPQDTTGFKDHFSQAATAYAAHRPRYPEALAEALAAAAPARGQALDVGCGNGQLTELLAGRFQAVLGTDASAEQIARAKNARETLDPAVGERLTYRAALAQNSGLPEASCDLVTAAQAAHWFTLPPFYAEARRVAKPGALVALITYGVLETEPGPVNDRLQDFYWKEIGPFWPPERRHVEEGYRSLPFPFSEVELPPLAIEIDWSLAGLLGYIDTWSAVRALERREGRGRLERFTEDLRELWGDPDLLRHVRFPLSLRVGRV